MREKISFVDRVVKSGSTPIHLIKCKDVKGRDCFYVIMCSKAKLGVILNAEEDISDMGGEGHIIASGFGHEVPQETKEMLKLKYGFDVDSFK